MNNQILLSKQIVSKYPSVQRYEILPINREICRYLNFFSDNSDLLTVSLIQKPLQKNRQLSSIRKDLGIKPYEYLKTINRLCDSDDTIIRASHNYRQPILLFLATYKILFDNIGKESVRRLMNKSSVSYAMRLLQKNDITEIRLALEDKFFAYLEPAIYNNYLSLLQYTKKNYQMRQKQIAKSFEELMENNFISARVQGRVKTIFSIHNKILKKNILFSQILDTIGIRILVEHEETCYRVMASILKNYPIITSRVKDYIAVPKDNGYQSIHLTILYENYPVEIQIRTYAMHDHAQYGKAAHVKYKKT